MLFEGVVAMRQKLGRGLLSIGLWVLAASASNQVWAQSDLSAISAVSALPVASVQVVSAVGASAVVASAVLSSAGAVLVVKAVESTARGTVYVLERASDGARVSVEIVGKGLGAASVVAGAVVTTSVIGAGIILSIAGEAIAFIPNELGRALLYNERLTR